VTLADFPRFPLLFGPSPVHRLERLTAHLGGPPLWAKREDVNSGIAFGGNKTRKLEYLVADALAQGADTLVSIGGVQSNHTRQVAAVAARAGLKAVLIQESWVDWDDPLYDKVGNIQLSRILGADVRLVQAGFGIGFKESWSNAIAEIEAAGGKPYAIPAGASDHRLGGLGFANWVVELEAQEQELGVFFDTVVVASGTGSTQGGMLAGVALGRERRILGIDITAKVEETRDAVTRIARNTAELIGAREIREDEILLDERYHAGIYGIPDKSTVDAIETCARLEGIITDPVYEGKSMAALLDLAANGELGDGNVLYVHLGGQPAINGYTSVLG
jgi:1-aminocyclopropane-1-carboxylate deaminase